MVESVDSGQIETRNGFAKVGYAGTGFLTIRRQALVDMIAHYPELRYARDHKPNGKLAGEPVAIRALQLHDRQRDRNLPRRRLQLLPRWTAMGREIWADLESKLTHVGAVDFTADMPAQFSSAREGDGE